jgi:hypothetical protein
VRISSARVALPELNLVAHAGPRGVTRKSEYKTLLYGSCEPTTLPARSSAVEHINHKPFDAGYVLISSWCSTLMVRATSIASTHIGEFVAMPATSEMCL